MQVPNAITDHLIKSAMIFCNVTVRHPQFSLNFTEKSVREIGYYKTDDRLFDSFNSLRNLGIDVQKHKFYITKLIIHEAVRNSKSVIANIEC